jgi:hypothetical protein
VHNFEREHTRMDRFDRYRQEIATSMTCPSI